MKCEICGVMKNLVVHHISYEPEITQVLCNGCHTMLHKHGLGPERPNGSFQQKVHPIDPRYRRKGGMGRHGSIKRHGNSYTTKVISLGRVTIPEEIREILGIDDGDFVEVQISKVERKKKKG